MARFVVGGRHSKCGAAGTGIPESSLLFGLQKPGGARRVRDELVVPSASIPMVPPRSRRRLTLAAWALFGASLVVAAYSNSFRNEFHFDDAHVLVDNLFVRSLSNIPRFFVDARTFSSLPANSAYRPLVSTSLAIDYWLGGGLSPVAFHVSQLVQLLALWGLLALFYRRLFDLALRDAANPLLALFSATLFAVHAANTETMNLMHARSEILSAAGLVAAFLVWLRSRTLRRSLLYLVPMILGALAKPPAVLFGPLLFLLVLFVVGRWRGKNPFRLETRTGIWRALKGAAPALVAGVITFVLVDRLAAPGVDYAGPDRWTYALTQTWVWVHYVRLFLLPTGLTADADLALMTHWRDPRFLAGVLLLCLLGAAFLASARRRRAWPVAFGLAWFAIGLLPTSSVIPLAEPMNEHRIFLAYIGLIPAAVWAVRLAQARAREPAPAWRRPAILAAGLALLLAHAAGTRVRNEAWRTEESLWRDVTRKSPRNGRGHMNYGLALMTRGDYEGARREFEAARAILPNYAFLEVNLGILDGATGRPATAEEHFRRALALNPRIPATRTYYARWLVEQGRAAAAEPMLVEVLRISPAEEMSRRFLMDFQAARGERDAAAASARDLLRIAPGDERALAYAASRFPFPGSTGFKPLFDLGLQLGAKGRSLDSAIAFQAALAEDPGSADTLNNLGCMLGRLGFREASRRYLLKALEVRPGWDLARKNLALVESATR